MKAFPTSKDNGHSQNQDGMDLRDYFAAKAMQGYVSKKLINGFDEDIISLMSYKIADAMMETRKTTMGD
jgi:hypothetical protein